MKLKLAVFRNPVIPTVNLLQEYRMLPYIDKNSVQVTEFVEVEFPDIPNETLVTNEIEQLRMQIKTTASTYVQEFNELQTKLALLQSAAVPAPNG